MRRVVIMLIGIGLLLGAFFVFKDDVRAWFLKKEISYSEEHEKHKKMWSELPLVENEIVFVGNSLSVEYPFDKVADMPLTKMAIRGDVSTTLSDRMPILMKRSPKVVVVSMGVNDICNFGKFDRDGYEQFVRSASEELSSRIVLMSITPVNFDDGLFANSDKANRAILEANILIRDMAQRYGAHYVNIHSRLSENGALAQAYTYDGIHLTEKGYAIWKTELEALFKQ